MKKLKLLFSGKKEESLLDFESISDSIEFNRECILKERAEIKESVRKANEEIDQGVRPSGKRFRL